MFDIRVRLFFFFSSRRRHTIFDCDWSSDVCSSDLEISSRRIYVLVRKSRYLNNVLEQDHRVIKGRCRPMLGFKSYRTAAVTLAGLELVHRIRKRQFKFGPGWSSRWSLKKQWDTALA